MRAACSLFVLCETPNSARIARLAGDGSPHHAARRDGSPHLTAATERGPPGGGFVVYYVRHA